MRTRTSLLALLIGVVVVGCSTPASQIRTGTGRPVPPAADTQRCPQGDCPIDVTFDPASVTPANTCGAKTPTVADLGGPGGGRTRVVLWMIRDSNFSFSTDSTRPALDIKGATGFFGVADVVGGGRVLRVRVNVADAGRSHEYGLNIVRRDGTRCSTYDPWMIE